MVLSQIRMFLEKLSLTLKIVLAGSLAAVLFILVHGTITYRANHQTAFAQGVAKKIGIASIRVSAKHDILLIEGTATRQQSEYAEKTAQYFIARFSKTAINPPTEIHNALEIRAIEHPRMRKQASR